MHRTSFLSAAMAAIAALVLAGTPVAAEAIKSYTKKGAYDDVRFELTNAIVGKGLVIDFNGKVGDMLARTGADVGSQKPIYGKAEYFVFCSAKLSRAMMEADPATMAYCPFVMFLYERTGTPGEITVGYRRLPDGTSPASKAVHAEINALLDGLARAAVQ